MGERERPRKRERETPDIQGSQRERTWCLERTGDLREIGDGGGGGWKVIGKDRTGGEGRAIKGSKAAEGFGGQGKTLVLNMRVHQEPMEGYEERCDMV